MSYEENLRNTAAEVDREASDVRFVLSFGVKLFLDGNKWCCLLGANLQEGVGTFGKSPLVAVLEMEKYLRRGDQ